MPVQRMPTVIAETDVVPAVAAEATTTLPYAPSAPSRRRRAVRVSLAVLALLAVAVSAKWWGPPLVSRVTLLSAQQRCMRYEAPTGAVVFRQGAAATYAAQPWNQFTHTSQYAIPAAWTTFERRFDRAGRQSHGVLFLHERTSPGGNRRLVLVDLNVSWAARGTMVSADWSVVRPATWTADPLYAQGGTGPADTQVPGLAGGRRSLLLFDYGQDVQVFAGRPDRADKSRFTIDFLAGGRTGTVDGRLMDDDSVVLEVRGAPAARHPSLPVRCPAEAPPVGVVR